MKKALALVVLALGFSILAPVAPAGASGYFPSRYGCAHSTGGYEQGLAGGTYVNDASAFGQAFAVSESNYHYINPFLCSTQSNYEHGSYVLVNEVFVIRNLLGTWVNCDHFYDSATFVSHRNSSFAHPVQPGTPCGTPGWPLGQTRIQLSGFYNNNGLLQGFNFIFYS